MCLCSLSNPVENYRSHYNLVNCHSGFIDKVIVTENRFLDLQGHRPGYGLLSHLTGHELVFLLVHSHCIHEMCGGKAHELWSQH